MGLQVQRLTANFGVEYLDVDIRADLDEEILRKVEQLWYEHGVVLFRNQDFREDQIVGFCRRLGDLEIHVREEYLDTKYPELLLVSNKREAGREIGILTDKELGWHHDQSYLERPAIGSMLCAFHLPNWGGDTYFANLSNAYDALPKKMKAKLDGLRAVHSYEYFNRAWSVPTNDKQTKKTPPVLQPVIRTHPFTGRKAIYVDPAMVPMIDGLPIDESRDLLDELFDWITRPEFIYRHEWKLGDAILWDNATTMHRRDNFDPQSIRLMKRTTILPPRSSQSHSRNFLENRIHNSLMHRAKSDYEYNRTNFWWSVIRLRILKPPAANSMPIWLPRDAYAGGTKRSVSDKIEGLLSQKELGMPSDYRKGSFS